MQPRALDIPSVFFKPDPAEMFQNWFALARESEPNDPEAMALATVMADGTPNVRMVLCKGFTADEVRFFTNSESDKGNELAAKPHAALCFYWKSLRRQVRVRGTVFKLPAEDDEAYFKTRHRDSQLGAWASKQSRPLKSMVVLHQEVYSMHDRFVDKPVPRPAYWGGYAVRPDAMEFWSECPNRLHERMLYTRTENGWQQTRLYP